MGDKTKPQAQNGGKIIGQGSYGCVFNRPLACTGTGAKTMKKGHVGKLSLKPQAQIEIKQSNILRNIAHAADYFALIDNTCELAPRKKQHDPDFEKCEVVQDQPYQKLVQITMPYAGVSLGSMTKAIDARTIHFYEFGRHLLEAGTLLLSHGIVHFDFHTGNILIKNPNTPIVIDFGISWQSSILNEKIADKLSQAGYQPEYGHYSPEMSIPEAIVSGLTLNNNLYNDILEKNGTVKILEKVFGIPFKKSLDSFRHFAEDSTSIKSHDWLKFYKTYWPKLDAWAIGRILLRIYSLVIFDPAFKDNSRAYLYKTAISGLLQTNPRRRLNLAQALRIWDPKSPLLKLDRVIKWTQAN